jgi:hypothetical protein
MRPPRPDRTSLASAGEPTRSTSVSSARTRSGELRSKAGPHAITIALLAVYVILRAWAEAPTSSELFPDSSGYLNTPLGFGEIRPFFVPLVYHVFTSDGSRVAAQCVFSTIAWGTLAVIVSSQIQTTILRYLTLSALLAFALIPELLVWDGALLSESVSLSLAALLLALLAVIVQRPTTPALIGFGVVATAWVFTRDANAPVLLLLCLPLAVVIGIRLSWSRATALAAIAAALFALSTISVNAGDRWRHPMITIIGKRVLPDPGRLDYFAQHGMPTTPRVLSLTGQKASAHNWAFDDIRPFISWVQDDARQTYARYLVSHPGYTLEGPWQDRQVILSGTVPTDSSFRQVLPIHNLLYFAGLSELALWTLVILVSAGVIAIRYGWDRRWAVPLVLIASTIPHGIYTYHGSALEVGRHSMTLAIMLRLGLMWLLFLAIDRVLAARARASNRASYLPSQVDTRLSAAR